MNTSASPSMERRPPEYTSAELRDCLAHVEALTGTRLAGCIPFRLRAMLDTWAADMRSQREERAEMEARDRAAAKGQP
jgi:hypothetical protein